MKKLCIFDFDGTLFDTICYVYENVNVILRENDLPTLNNDKLIKLLGGNIDQIVSKILGEEKSTPENIKKIRLGYEERCRKVKDDSLPYNGIVELLHLLQEKNIILAINSNRKTESIKYFVDRHLSDIAFLDIQGHTYNHPSKPDAYGINTIIKKSGLEKEDTVYIGDSSTDIRTACNAGVDCVIVKWGYGDENDYSNEYPIEVIDEPLELLEVVL